MKKFMSLIAIAAMALAFTASSALAAFEDNHLIRVIYSTAGGNEEIATDLGLVSDVLNAADNTSFAAGSVSLTDFANATWADLNVAYFAVNSDYSAWLSGAAGASSLPVKEDGGFSVGYNDLGAATAIGTYYRGLVTGTETTVKGSQTYTNSYSSILGGVNAGYFGTFLSAPVGEANLADLATVGYVDQGLFHSPLTYYPDTTLLASLRTMEDGSTIINPAAVPVPASVLLFGTGLVGLIGLRRKSA